MKHPIKHVGLKHIDWVGLVLTTDLPSISKSLVMYLARFMNKDQDVAWPSHSRIMAELSISKGSLSSHFNLLESEGWITRVRGNSKTNTRYQVSFPKQVEKAVGLISKGSSGDELRSSGGELGVVQEVNTNSQLNRQSNSNSAFDNFWEIYPKKQNKKKAFVSFNNLTKEKQKKAIDDVRTRFNDTPFVFIPLPTTYLNGERWEDISEPKQVARGKEV